MDLLFILYSIVRPFLTPSIAHSSSSDLRAPTSWTVADDLQMSDSDSSDDDEEVAQPQCLGQRISVAQSQPREEKRKAEEEECPRIYKSIKVEKDGLKYKIMLIRTASNDITENSEESKMENNCATGIPLTSSSWQNIEERGIQKENKSKKRSAKGTSSKMIRERLLKKICSRKKR